MPDLDQLLSEFIEQHLAGSNPDPWAFIERADEGERQELEGLIDAYYVDAPGRPWDPEAFEGSAEQRLAGELATALTGEAGLWPVVLPSLRHRAKLKRVELVAKLAEALGQAAKEEKVGGYYHRMEQGSLPAEGVSSRVLDALGGLVGMSGMRLRELGESLGAGGAGAPAEVFARRAAPSPGYAEQRSPGEAESAGEADYKLEPPDEVDELFTGGD